jgi:E3 ubiquitin-protein ligase ZSWIM2
MDHQVGSMGFTMVKCPLCRSDFNTVEGLKTELENSSQSQKKNYRDKVQFGLSCSGCKKNPIVGKYHKCNVCKPLHLCDDCFMKGFHDQHTFQNRLTRNSKWMPSSRNVTTVLPSGFINDLQNREITDEDYQTLLLLDSGPSKQASIPLHIVNSFPLYKYRGQTSGKAGKCKICGDLFHLGAMIRKIPWYVLMS